MIALIVSYNTPDLTRLAVDSLRVFAPEILPIVLNTCYEDSLKWLDPAIPSHTPFRPHWGGNAEDHGEAIHWARDELVLADQDNAILLLDSDCAVLSRDFYPSLMDALGKAEVAGGLRSWGDVSNCFFNGKPILHANCLAMRRDVFDRVTSFMPSDKYDTAAEVSAWAKSRWVFPHWNRGTGPLSLGTRSTTYFKDEHTPLWAHLGRGTSFRPKGFWRESLREAAAYLGSPRARKILSYQNDRLSFVDGVQRHLRQVDPTYAARAFDDARALQEEIYGHGHPH